MIDYFKELNIQIDASDNEVKNAYFNMTKKYPPEKFPKEYRVIRDAYETLIDKSKREEYILENFDYEGRNILKEAVDAFKKEEFKEAILNFETILKKYPNNSKVKRDLALSLMKVGNYKKSSKIFKELVIREPNNIENYKALIKIYEDNKEKDNLESVLKKSIKLKNVEVDFYIKLFKLYNEEKKDYKEALIVLREGLNNKNIDSKKYKLYMKFLDITDRLNLKSDFSKGCKALSEFTIEEDYEEVKEEIFFLLDRCLREFHFKNGSRLTATALILIDERRDSKDIEKIMKLRRSFLEFSRLYEDKDIDKNFKKVIFYNGVNSFLKNDIQFNRDVENVNGIFFENFNFENYEVVNSVGRLKKEYRNVYLETKDINDRILGKYSKSKREKVTFEKERKREEYNKEIFHKDKESSMKSLFKNFIKNFKK